MGSFPPLEWSEEGFIKRPPFILENNGGKVFATPTNSNAEMVLDKLSRTMGLKKRKQGHMYYLITKGSSLKAFRQFGWFVRRSWRNMDFAVLWAAVYLSETKGGPDSPVSLDAVAELAGCSRKQSAAMLEKIGSKSVGVNHASGDYRIDKEGAELMLRKMVSELPNWTEELIMQTLCSGIGGSASEIYERVMTQGLGMSATYKTLEKLKRNDYVHPLKHYRVNERGPMRELLAANCGSCFYGYASPERCLTDTLRQLEDMFENIYGKKLSEEEREKLRSSISAVPYSSRLSRRVYELLRLMNQVDHVAKEGGVPTVLSKIEESYGVEFPLRKLEPV